MNKRKQHGIDDGSDEDSVFDDDEPTFERIHRQREHRAPAKSPRGSRDGGVDRDSDKPTRRREFASINAWGAPY